MGAETYVNGKQITDAVVLKQGQDGEGFLVPGSPSARWPPSDRFLCVAREPHRDGEEPRVQVQPPGAGQAGEGAQRHSRAPGGAGGLELRPEGAAGETGNRH